MDFHLPEELRMLKEIFVALSIAEMIPVERQTCEGDELKPEWRENSSKRAKDLGIRGLEVPEEYGGLGLSVLARVVVWEELAAQSRFPHVGKPSPGPTYAPSSINCRVS